MHMRTCVSKRRGVLAALLLTMMAAAARPAGAATFTVNNTSDSGDGTCDVGHCSLRDAMMEANATPGLDTVAFNIPGGGVHVIMLTSGELPQINEAVIIDGYTQPGA